MDERRLELEIAYANATEVVQGFMHELGETKREVGETRADLRSLRDFVKPIAAMVRDGNGGPPHATRIALLEADRQRLDHLTTSFEEFKQSTERRSSESAKARLSALVAVICAIITTAGVVVAAVAGGK